MEISYEALKDFKRIYKEEFKETITNAEALEMAQRVLNLFSIITKPLPKEYENITIEEIEKYYSQF